MKALKKILSVVLLAALALSLSSCLSLDEAKAHHMKFTDDSFETVSFGGKTYKRLPSDKNGYMFNLAFFETENYWLTAEDVPVLLSDRYGSAARYEKDHDIIYCPAFYFDSDGGEYHMYYSSDSSQYFYATEEHYDEYSKMLSEPDLTAFATTVLELSDPDEETYGSYKEKALILSEEASALLDDAIKKGERTDRPDLREGSYSEQTFYRTSADGFVMDNTAYIIIDSGDGFWFEGPSGYTKLSDEAADALEPYYQDDYAYHYFYYD